MKTSKCGLYFMFTAHISIWIRHKVLGKYVYVAAAILENTA